MPIIQLLREGGVARIGLNRPDNLNALSPLLLRDLVAVCDDLSHDDSVRVITLEGVGETFSAGADLPLFEAELRSSPAKAADLGRVATEALAALPQITVAVIRGHCVGGALVLAAACDLRISSDDSRFWIPELEAGIPLAWGGMAHLVRLVGATAAADLVLSCRPFSADDALRVGFVSRVVAAGDLESEATDLIETVAGRARLPLRVTKKQLQAIRNGTFDPRDDADALLQSVADPEAGALLRSYADRLA